MPGGTDSAGRRMVARARTQLRRLWRYLVYLVWDQALRTQHPAWERFFARRCPHLAGMIAYFGVLSIIPAAFLFISALSLAGVFENSDEIVTWIEEQLRFAIPDEGADTIVATVDQLRDNTASLGAVGVIGLAWATSNFFSSIESAMNIIYGVNNRHFIFQKAWVVLLMFGALVALVGSTLLVAVALPIIGWLEETARDTFNVPLSDSVISIIVVFAFAFFFFLSCYRFLPNTVVHTRHLWRGAVVAASAFTISVLVLPEYVAENRGGALISAFAGAFIVLLWFYLMAFILLVGGVYGWWYREKQRLRAAEAGSEPAADAG